MVLKLGRMIAIAKSMFENDVKMYGTQARMNLTPIRKEFENDVKMYGTQAH
mgnify:CR=1 FL=1